MNPTEPYGLSGHPMVWHGRPDEGVADLTVMYDPLEDVSRSMWRPSPGELEALNRGYPVILEVFGQHPPVTLYVPWEGQLKPEAVPDVPTISGVPGLVDEGTYLGRRVDLDAAFRRAGEAQGFA